MNKKISYVGAFFFFFCFVVEKKYFKEVHFRFQNLQKYIKIIIQYTYSWSRHSIVGHGSKPTSNIKTKIWNERYFFGDFSLRRFLMKVTKNWHKFLKKICHSESTLNCYSCINCNDQLCLRIFFPGCIRAWSWYIRYMAIWLFRFGFIYI